MWLLDVDGGRLHNLLNCFYLICFNIIVSCLLPVEANFMCTLSAMLTVSCQLSLELVISLRSLCVHAFLHSYTILALYIHTTLCASPRSNLLGL
jgi:hypothetical protein